MAKIDWNGGQLITLNPGDTATCAGGLNTGSTSLQQGVCKPSVPRGGDRVVRKYATGLGLDRGYSAHPMRATFITAALENGAQLEEVAPLTP
jgi:hypothetical protein